MNYRSASCWAALGLFAGLTALSCGGTRRSAQIEQRAAADREEGRRANDEYARHLEEGRQRTEAHIAERNAKRAQADAQLAQKRSAREQRERDAIERTLAATAERNARLQGVIDSVEFDAVNELEWLGYRSSKRLFAEPGVVFYVGAAHPHSAPDAPPAQVTFVAVHDVAADAPVVELVDIERRPNGELARFTYSAAAVERYSQLSARLAQCAPLVRREGEPTGHLVIRHYTTARDLANAREMDRASFTGCVAPLIETHFAPEGAGWQPAYATDRDGKRTAWTTHGGAPTHAEALAVRARIDADKDEERRRSHLTDEQRAQERAAAEAAQDARLRPLAEARGLVYRDWPFWHQFRASGVMRDIFNGELELSAGQGLFPLTYMRFVERYSERCKELLPTDAPGFDITEITEMDNGWGPTVIEGPTKRIRVQPAMWPMYRHYKKNFTVKDLPNGFEMVNSRRGREQAEFVASVALNAQHDAALLFRLERCDSGFMRQFEENLRRAAEGRPSLQKSPGDYDYLSK